MKKPVFLMCPPDYFDIDYSINPWMDKKNKANGDKTKQWRNLKKELENAGASIKLIEPKKGWPDMVYLDVGIVYKNYFIPSNFRFPERQGERKYDIAWFRKNKFKIIEISKEYLFEGHGDTLWAGDKLFFGYGFRSGLEAQREIVKKIKKINSKIQIIPVELINPYFYHLDTCFCPLDKDKAMYYPGAFSAKAKKILKENIALIPVSENEAKKFACNSVVIKKNVIMPAFNPRISFALEKKGFIVRPVEMDEFIKGGGACKCLSIQIR
jgi:N-dimethylarginine dimethylaminohydrolase